MAGFSKGVDTEIVAEHFLNFSRRGPMLYETAWLFFALGVGILISIGLLGLIFSPAIPPRILKVFAMIISLLIVLTGIYFSSQWSAQKKGIQVLSQQAEEALKQYLAAHPKK
jgi:disulfide bond formation protein DsbB